MYAFASRASQGPRRVAAALALLAAAACSDTTGTGAGPSPEPGPAPEPQGMQLTCSITVNTGALACATPAGETREGQSRAIYGSQDVLVRLASANADTANGVFEVDVTVTNLLQNQAIGTRDGQNVDPAGVRVFFGSQPAVTGGTGTVSINNADGDATFLDPEQPYFQYDGIIAPGATSAAKPWRFNITPGVQRFQFVVYIAAEAQARLVISEMMANPAGSVQDSLGEYVEVYNAGQLEANLRGFYVRDNGGTDTIKTDVMVPAGGYVVLGRSMDPAKNGGVPVAYAYTARIGTTSTQLTFSNSGADRFTIVSPQGIVVDSVAYSSSGVVAKAGIARQLADLTSDNSAVDGTAWQDATEVYDVANNNRGTPGYPNSGGTGGGTVGPVASVSVTPGNASLAPNETQQYSATGRDGTGMVSPTTFTWSSTNTAVATVSTTGLVTAVADGTTTIRATSANGIVGSTTLTVVTTSSSAVYRNHLEFGTPADGDASDDILLTKRTYALSYSSARGGPNWVAWDLNSTHFGGADRCDCFAADPSLPQGAKVVTTGDYSGSGYSRGHMVMSEQRTRTDADNETTFLMTNILPQLQDMNGGPWLKFENYTNTLARSQAREVYNIAGGVYGANPATLKNAGRVAIPTHTWKIIVVMPYGQGLAQVTDASSIQVIAVMMPNVSGIQSNGWEMYRTTVDAIEAATGYDFLSALPDGIEAAVEAQAN
jgi:endonuclease G, mitochondrial